MEDVPNEPEGAVQLSPDERSRCSNEGAADASGTTPLLLAATRGHAQVVESLLHSGASANVQNDRGETPLYAASREGHRTVVWVLLCHSADPRIGSANAEPRPIDAAVSGGHRMVVEYLVGAGAWLEVDTHLQGLVINSGADPNIVDICGQTALHKATNVELVRQLLQSNVLVDARDSSNNTPLHCACRRRDLDIVKLLIEHGASVNAKNEANETPLYLSLLKREHNVLKTLLENDVDATMSCGWEETTPLRIAVEDGDVEGTRLLLERLGVNGGDNYGSTPLHLAVEVCDVNLVESLIRQGAKINAVDIEGRTPLHWVTNAEIAKLLLRNGADASIKGGNGMTPLQEAEEDSDNEQAVIAVLKKHVSQHVD